MGAAVQLFDERTRVYLRMIAEAQGPSADYPIAKILHTAGPDQMHIWNRMISRHSPGNWGAAHKIYANSAKKHGIDPWGTSSKLGKPSSATWGKGTAKYAGPGSMGQQGAAPKKKAAPARVPHMAPAAHKKTKDLAASYLTTPEGKKEMARLMAGMIKSIKKGAAPGTSIDIEDLRDAINSAMTRPKKKVA